MSEDLQKFIVGKAIESYHEGLDDGLKLALKAIKDEQARIAGLRRAGKLDGRVVKPEDNGAACGPDNLDAGD